MPAAAASMKRRRRRSRRRSSLLKVCPEQKNKHGESSMKRLRIAVASNVRYPITFEVLSPAPLSFSLSLSHMEKRLKVTVKLKPINTQISRVEFQLPSVSMDTTKRGQFHKKKGIHTHIKYTQRKPFKANGKSQRVLQNIRMEVWGYLGITYKSMRSAKSKSQTDFV